MLYLFSFINVYIAATACRLTALGKQSPKLSLLIDRKVKLPIGALGAFLWLAYPLQYFGFLTDFHL